MSRRYKIHKKTNKKTRQRTGDYRIFVGAFPTGELADHIQAVRENLDAKTAAIAAPHVTLAGTYWRSGPATVKNEANIVTQFRKLAPKLSAFDLHLKGVRTFGQRVIYLGVRADSKLLAMRAALLNILGADKHRRFTPHLTLAMRLEQPLFDEALAELGGGEWGNGRFTAPINQLHLMLRGPDDPAWRSIHTIPLKPR